MYLQDEEVKTLIKETLFWLREDGYLFCRESCYHQSGILMLEVLLPVHKRRPAFKIYPYILFRRFILFACLVFDREQRPKIKPYKIQRAGNVRGFVHVHRNSNRKQRGSIRIRTGATKICGCVLQGSILSPPFLLLTSTTSTIWDQCAKANVSCRLKTRGHSGILINILVYFLAEEQ